MDDPLQDNNSTNSSDNLTSYINMEGGQHVQDDHESNKTHFRSSEGFENSDSKSTLLARARKEFNKNRRIIIKNVPPVTYEVSQITCFTLGLYFIFISSYSLNFA